MVPEWRPQPTHRKPALHIVSMHHETPWLANRNGRLPSSKPAVSNLKLWCTLRFMHVRRSTCIEPTWDHGGQHGQESQEGSCEEEDREEKDCEEEVESFATLSLPRHIKARAVLSPGN